MKLSFKMEGLTFEDRKMEQKGQLGPITFELDATPAEVIEMAKNDRELILGLVSIGKEYFLQKRSKNKETKNNPENLSKIARDAFEEIKPKPSKVDDGELC